jgi:hypothetical protein
LAIERGLPERFGGWPVRFSALEAGTVRHHVESPHSTPGWAATFESIRELVTVGSIDQLTHADDAMVNFTPWPQRLRDTYRQLLGR